jgi:hypothetical protein
LRLWPMAVPCSPRTLTSAAASQRDTEIWRPIPMERIASAFDFVRKLGDFSYGLSSLDHVWDVLFPDQAKKWHHLHVNKYKHTFYITHVGSGSGLEVEPQKGLRPMDSSNSSFGCNENHDQPAMAWTPMGDPARWQHHTHRPSCLSPVLMSARGSQD